MLVGLCGGKSPIARRDACELLADHSAIKGICAGKQSVADYLTEHHGFNILHLLPPQPEILNNQVVSPGENCTPLNVQEQQFASAEDLLDFVTKRWQGRWVTTSVRDEATLDIFLRRPFFLLVSVDCTNQSTVEALSGPVNGQATTFSM